MSNELIMWYMMMMTQITTLSRCCTITCTSSEAWWYTYQNNTWIPANKAARWMKPMKLRLPSPGTAVETSPETGWGLWRDPRTWRNRWRPQSYLAWWSKGPTCWRALWLRTRYTTCDSWPWTERKSTASPRSRSKRAIETEMRRWKQVEWI